MPNYQNGKIYKICTHQNDLIYIGSTTRPLSERMAEHKRKFKNEKLNTSSKQILEYEDAYIELIENWPCDTKEELDKREGHHIRNNNCVNKCIAGRSTKEYYEDNKENISEYQKKWREENREKICENRKEYYETNKEIILEYLKNYRNQNREKINDQVKDYREKNKELIKKKKQEPFTCICGSIVNKDGKAEHFKTKKHQDFVSSN